MNKYDGVPRYYLCSVSAWVTDWIHRYDRDHVLVVESPTADIRHNRSSHRVVANCPTKEAAVAAMRLLSSESAGNF